MSIGLPHVLPRGDISGKAMVQHSAQCYTVCMYILFVCAWGICDDSRWVKAWKRIILWSQLSLRSRPKTTHGYFTADNTFSHIPFLQWPVATEKYWQLWDQDLFIMMLFWRRPGSIVLPNSTGLSIMAEERSFRLQILWAASAPQFSICFIPLKCSFIVKSYITFMLHFYQWLWANNKASAPW